APAGLGAASAARGVGAIPAAGRAGLRGPGAVAVVSSDDPFFGDLIAPPVTALRRNERELGELAASLLLHAMRTESVGPPTEVRLPVELVVRRACGCPSRS